MATCRATMVNGGNPPTATPTKKNDPPHRTASGDQQQPLLGPQRSIDAVHIASIHVQSYSTDSNAHMLSAIRAGRISILAKMQR